MKKINLDYSKVFNFINQDELNQMKVLVDEVSTIKKNFQE